MKKLSLLIVFGIAIVTNSCSHAKNEKALPLQDLVDASNASNTSHTINNVIHINNEEFKKLIYNYEDSKEWKYLGNKPCIIDFYADWCGPCRLMAPKLDEIAKEYNGKLIIYKVDTDKEQALSSQLGIQSLPTLLFVPLEGKPQGSLGLIPKESLVKAIHEVLLIK